MRRSASEIIRNLEGRIARLESGMGRTAKSLNRKVEYTCIKTTPYYGVYNGKYEGIYYKKGESGSGVLHAEFGDYVMIEESDGLFMVLKASDFDIS